MGNLIDLGGGVYDNSAESRGNIYDNTPEQGTKNQIFSIQRTCNVTPDYDRKGNRKCISIFKTFSFNKSDGTPSYLYLGGFEECQGVRK